MSLLGIEPEQALPYSLNSNDELAVNVYVNIWVKGYVERTVTVHSSEGDLHFYVYVNEDLITSVSEITNDEVSLYPNPVRNILNINIIADKVDVFDLTGRKLMTMENTNTVDVSNLIPGVYFVKINNDIVRKIVVSGL